MYCRKCGKELVANAAFCQFCGTQTLLHTNTVLNTPSPLPTEILQKKTRDVIRQTFSSKLFLFVCIAYAALTIFGFFNDIFLLNGGTLADSFNRLASSFATDIYFETTSACTNVLLSALFVSPAVILTIGLWMNYISAVGKSEMRTFGLTMIKGVAIADLVFTSVMSFLVMVLVCIALILSTYGETAVGIIVTILLIIFLCPMLVLLIVYQAKVIRTVNTVKYSIITGLPSDKISALVGVMFFISGGLNVIYIPLYLFSGQIHTVFYAILSAAAMIVLGILLFSYKKKMRALQNGVNI